MHCQWISLNETKMTTSYSKRGKTTAQKHWFWWVCHKQTMWTQYASIRNIAQIWRYIERLNDWTAYGGSFHMQILSVKLLIKSIHIDSSMCYKSEQCAEPTCWHTQTSRKRQNNNLLLSILFSFVWCESHTFFVLPLQPLFRLSKTHSQLINNGFESLENYFDRLLINGLVICSFFFFFSANNICISCA